MLIEVKGKYYETNLTDKDKIDKCIEFFSVGCTSYAISFNNLPGSVITKISIDNLKCFVLRDFNFNYKFVPEKAKDIKSAKDLLSKGLDLIELI